MNASVAGFGDAWSSAAPAGVGPASATGAAAATALASVTGAAAATPLASVTGAEAVASGGVLARGREFDAPQPIIRQLGRVEYEPTWRAMQRFTDERGPQTPDEIWFLEHPPVFTLGLNASVAHVLAPGDIPVVQIDRGGQVTYHGPGQLVVYPLVDLRRAKLGVRDLVTALEQSVIRLASDFGISAECRRGAPGIYVGDKKLGSIGIRVRRGSSYHGLAVNVNLDLEPFHRINPCGYQGLEMTQFAGLSGLDSVTRAAEAIEPHLLGALGFAAIPRP